MGAEWIVRSLRNGFSAFILGSKRDGDIPGGRDPLFFNMKLSYRGKIFINPDSNWKCFNHGYFFMKQMKPHLRDIDQYPIPFPLR